MNVSTLTINDKNGRCWTIMTDRTVVGFQWRIYCHAVEVGIQALELVHPGGVAHGWTDDDHDDETVRALLVAIMGLKGAAVWTVSGDDVRTNG